MSLFVIGVCCTLLVLCCVLCSSFMCSLPCIVLRVIGIRRFVFVVCVVVYWVVRSVFRCVNVVVGCLSLMVCC